MGEAGLGRLWNAECRNVPLPTKPLFPRPVKCVALPGRRPPGLALTDQKKASAGMPRPFKQFQVQSYSSVCVLQQLQ